MSIDLDRSTVSSLEPGQPLGIHFEDYKHGVHLQGSFTQPFRQIRKEAEVARKYIKGDPIRLIDWRAFARADQLMVREQLCEEMASVAIVLDDNLSMHWPDQRVLAITGGYIVKKIEIAVRLGFHLAYLHTQLGDKVHLLVTRENLPEKTRNIFQPRSLQEITESLEIIKKDGFDFRSLATNGQDTNKLKRFDLLYYLSDCLTNNHHHDYANWADHYCLFHVLSSLETNDKWLEDGICYFDEAFVKREFLGEVLRKNQVGLNRVMTWSKEINERTKRIGSYFLIQDNTSLASYYGCLRELARGGARGGEGEIG